jgi:anti-sigma B factor antagonist
MTITERPVGDVQILDIEGSITGDAGAAQRLADKVRSLLQQGEKRLVLNLASVAYVDSAGLGELVHAYTTAARQGGSVKLLNVTKRLNDLLVITKLVTVFETFDSESSAVSSFTATV